MRSAFVALAITDALLIAITAVVGGMVTGERSFALHFALGLVTTIFTCLCQCVVFAYFMAGGKMVRAAVDDAHLDEAQAIRAVALKSRAMRVLMPAVAAALVAAVAGAWATTHPEVARVHLAAALISVGVQAAALVIEYGLIVEHGRLMDAVFVLHERFKHGVARQ